MQFCIIFDNYFDKQIVDQFESKIVMTNETLINWALDLDTKILDHHQKIDWVLHCVDSNILLDNFYAQIKFNVNDNRIFLTNNGSIDILNQNFYCRPHVLSYFSSHYKLSTPSIVNNLTDRNKLFYMALRNNLEIVYL